MASILYSVVGDTTTNSTTLYVVDMLSVETDHIVLGGVVMGLEGFDGR